MNEQITRINMKYSVVVPVFNEEENIPTLHAEIKETLEGMGEPYEIIFIDDGSSDNTVQVVQTLSPVTLIRLRKNYGQTAAMDAGIKTATGDIIITMDGDGQNPPQEIPKLVKAMEETGKDIISGWRKNRKDTPMKKFTSRGANFLRGVLVKDEIHDSGCSLKAYRRECFEGVDLFGEMHRFIPAVLSWSGFTIGEVVVEHRPRMHGSTKYNWRRIVKGFIDMLAVWFWRKYSDRPLHLFGAGGLSLIGLGGLLTAYLLIQKVVFKAALTQSSLPLLAVFLVVLGVQFFVSGILADLAIRNYYSGGKTYYTIRSVDRR